MSMINHKQEMYMINIKVHSYLIFPLNALFRFSSFFSMMAYPSSIKEYAIVSNVHYDRCSHYFMLNFNQFLSHKYLDARTTFQVNERKERLNLEERHKIFI